MGFSYYGYGNIMPCGISSGQLWFRLPSDEIITCETSFDTDLTIPEQVNLFRSNSVMFLLYHDGFEYIGRYDGTLSKFKINDNIVQGLGWFKPPVLNLEPIGIYCVGKYYYNVMLNKLDYQSIHIKEIPLSATLDEKVFGVNFSMDRAFTSFLIDSKSGNTYIYNIGGKRYVNSPWNVQASSEQSNYRNFF